MQKQLNGQKFHFWDRGKADVENLNGLPIPCVEDMGNDQQSINKGLLTEISYFL